MMTGSNNVARSWARSVAGLAVCLVLIAATAVGCASSSSTSKSDSGVTTLASANGPKLDLATLKAATEKPDVIQTHSITTETDGHGEQTVGDQTTTVSKSTKRVRVESAANQPTGLRVPTRISEGNDIYLKGSAGWTKLVLDPSLHNSAKEFAQPTSLVEMVENLKVEVRQDGTMDEDGLTLKRYRATDSGKELFAALSVNSPLSKLTAQLPNLDNLVGSFELGVDDTGFPRIIRIRLSLTVKDGPHTVEVATTSKPLPGGTTVDLPPADQIVATKPVTSMDELVKEILPAGS